MGADRHTRPYTLRRHLFLEVTGGATDQVFKWARPEMDAPTVPNAPAPGPGVEYVCHEMHISASAETTVSLKNGTGANKTVWKLKLAADAGGLPFSSAVPLEFGINNVPYLTLSGTPDVIIHLFCTIEPPAHV